MVDPQASVEEVKEKYGFDIKRQPNDKYDAFILAVGHTEYKSLNAQDLLLISNGKPVVFDVKSIYKKHPSVEYIKM